MRESWAHYTSCDVISHHICWYKVRFGVVLDSHAYLSYHHFNDITVQELKDLQIIQDEILQQFEKFSRKFKKKGDFFASVSNSSSYKVGILSDWWHILTHITEENTAILTCNHSSGYWAAVTQCSKYNWPIIIRRMSVIIWMSVNSVIPLFQILEKTLINLHKLLKIVH